MAQVTLPYNLAPGTPENVNNLMSNLTALRDGVNTIDTAQIASSAVSESKLGTGAVTETKIGSNAVSADKLTTGLAAASGLNQTGVTNRAAMTPMLTEKTKTGTSISFSDVANASLSFTVTAGTYLLVGYQAKLKNSVGALRAYGRVMAGSCIANAQDFDSSSANAPDYNNATVIVKGTTYVNTAGCALFAADEIGTGSQTFKWQISNDGSATTNTTYIDRIYLTVVQLTF